LPANTQRALIPAAQAGDADAIRALVESNVRLAANVARKHKRNGLDADDLMAVACGAILDAIRKFDTSKRAKFSTVARQWMVARCQELVRANAPVSGDTRVSRALFCKIPAIQRAVAADGLAVTVENVATRAALEGIADYDEVCEAMALMGNSAVSTSKPVGESDNAATFGDTLVSENLNQFDRLERTRKSEKVRAVLAAFTDTLKLRDVHIMQARVCSEIFGTERVEQPVLAAELGITKQRVGQIEKKIIQKMQVFFANQGVTP
ncbi:MAG: sigma-70 family RNA polymerase sigma factor, partial [Pseudomonadota bacterium]|nr:sigma-70 family RNA polymerase sigma factor [Pseudomonadota bacterium]